ncbi:YozQ family protein [Bacillus sp. T33-2]|uniref:YozQ family protein n=1 Tax=Bacillus sp. T33-2 TaxID=2054168 RepID=UPI000C771DA0|nr:YozQ family protein [Bacillus sp. T33-2]PLR97690.1 DUF4025 domain-containing protein [Bacillus sp. T33-2]
MQKDKNKESVKIAGRFFDVADYNRDDQVSRGLAITHEQVSDNYMGEEAAPPVRNNPEDNPSIPRNNTER